MVGISISIPGGSRMLAGSGGGPPAPSPPVGISNPELASPIAIIGSALACSTGTWSGYPDPTFAYQWHGSIRGELAGEASDTYVPTPEAIGEYFWCIVTATNSEGFSSRSSDNSNTVASNDTQLSEFRINGDAPVDGNLSSGALVNLANLSQPLSIDIVTLDPASTFTPPTGMTGPWVTGDNVITFDVTAPDGYTVQNYTMIAHVLTAGKSQIFDITVPPMVGGNTSGTYFELDVGFPEGGLAVMYDNGGKFQVSVFDFTGLERGDFETGSPGRFVVLYKESEAICYWFNTGLESQPDASSYGATTYQEVNIALYFSDVDIAQEFCNVIGGYFDTPNTAVRYGDPTTGPRTDASAGTTFLNVFTQVTGEPPPPDPPGYLFIARCTTYSDDATDEQIRDLMVTTLASFYATTANPLSGAQLRCDTVSVGARRAPQDIDSGTSFTMVQEGENPA